ncbi:MAG TPA: hypothetical protein VLT83_11995 [Opitutaceae bacterium]|nr:hypothetical protein [Opitutaceae bacterium]
MKRITPIVALALLLAVLSSVVWAAGQSTKTAPAAKSAAAAPGVALAGTLSQITGVAISPLLGVSAVGAYTWYRTPAEKRASLPWYTKPAFWLTGLLAVGACACKDSLGTALPPGLKKPFDVAETLENKLSGAVAVGAFVPFTLDSVVKMLGSGGTGVAGSPLAASGLAMIQVGAIDLSWAGAVLMFPLAAAIFVVVWITSHAINVLILLSPWGAVDAALKSFRLAVLSLLTITASINPAVGALLSAVIVVVAWLCAGWAFRLTCYGTIFCWDFFTLRRLRFRPAANDNWLFAGSKLGQAPARTYGRLHRNDDGGLVFNYRPWLVLRPRRAEVPTAGLAVGRGAFYSTIVARRDEREATLFLLPPRYRGHEADLAHACNIRDVIDVGLRRAWAWLKETLGFGRRPAAPAAAS